ncbi:uncharacterized protein DS421_15g494330 [Arachis hypogaea]|nr:uncharacterized protein DS421_15g494330 [Arachis hypogaea]
MHMMHACSTSHELTCRLNCQNPTHLVANPNIVSQHEGNLQPFGREFATSPIKERL